MQELNVKPYLKTFSTLAKGLCKAGYIAEAIDNLNWMKKLNIRTDEVLINTLLDGCFK
jgi:pentatricopeptide repeat protein